MKRIMAICLISLSLCGCTNPDQRETQPEQIYKSKSERIEVSGEAAKTEENEGEKPAEDLEIISLEVREGYESYLITVKGSLVDTENYLTEYQNYNDEIQVMGKGLPDNSACIYQNLLYVNGFFWCAVYQTEDGKHYNLIESNKSILDELKIKSNSTYRYWFWNIDVQDEDIYFFMEREKENENQVIRDYVIIRKNILTKQETQFFIDEKLYGRCEELSHKTWKIENNYFYFLKCKDDKGHNVEIWRGNLKDNTLEFQYKVKDIRKDDYVIIGNGETILTLSDSKQDEYFDIYLFCQGRQALKETMKGKALHICLNPPLFDEEIMFSVGDTIYHIVDRNKLVSFPGPESSYLSRFGNKFCDRYLEGKWETININDCNGIKLEEISIGPVWQNGDEYYIQEDGFIINREDGIYAFRMTKDKKKGILEKVYE